MRTATRVALIALAALSLAQGACGRKGAPRPAVDVLPATITDLEAEPVVDGIRLSWDRPTRYTGGDRMRDLGGFWIQRADAPGAPFELIATLSLNDLERFQQKKRFRHVDGEVEAGRTYRYRVVSFTLDRYVSGPSNIAVAQSGAPQDDAGTTETAPEEP